MTEQGGWCTIESDPGIFSELLSSIGVEDVQVEELCTLDLDELKKFGQVYGIVFLFKYRSNEENERGRQGVISAPEGLFFANQTIQNACATQAILSIVLNSPLKLGDELRTFKEFSKDMDSFTRGMCLSNSETIRAAHNSFAVQQTLVIDDPTAEKEDPFHFVAYIPWNGRVYELDGMQDGPRDLGEESGEGWIETVISDVFSRIEEYSDDEIRFNLMAIVEDQTKKLENEIVKLEGESNQDESRILDLRAQLEQQSQKKELWALENARRRWNFMPFIMEFLKTMAKAGHAEELINSATARKREAYNQALKARKSDK